MQVARRQLDWPLLTVLLMGVLYLLLPSINSSGDTYAYACLIRDGKELFMPHHLLYNAFYYIPVKLFYITNTLPFICIMNAVFAMGCLLFANAILSPFTSKRTRAMTLIFLGACFGFMRYATTGETYILPLFFSLWASWAAINRKSTYWVALLASVACLFHQVHFFWWLGLLFFIMAAYKDEWWKNFVRYGIVSCIVPVVYILVFYLTDNDSSSVVEFIAHDYVHHDSVSFSIKAKSLLLTPVNLIRTFYQVHGYMLPLIQKYWVIGFFMLVSVVLGIMGCIKLRRVGKEKTDSFFYSRFAKYHLVIFFLQLLFAFISDGNAEFMVMLPFALALSLFPAYRFRRLPAYAFAGSILIWNLPVGLIPAHFFELTSEPAMVRYVENHPDEVYYLSDKQTVDTNLEYNRPGQNFQLYAVKEDTYELDSLLQQNDYVLSNAFSPKVMSRSSMVSSIPQLSSYQIETVDSIVYDLGVLIVSKISLPQSSP